MQSRSFWCSLYLALLRIVERMLPPKYGKCLIWQIDAWQMCDVLRMSYMANTYGNLPYLTLRAVIKRTFIFSSSRHWLCVVLIELLLLKLVKMRVLIDDASNVWQPHVIRLAAVISSRLNFEFNL